MKQTEFELLVAAGAIDNVTLYATPDGEWSVWGYGEKPSWAKDSVQAARGGMRTWASLDNAYRWLRERGWSGMVTIDASTSPVSRSTTA